ncbi:MAG: tetratricopeptide repeat protein [Bacteroidales bacterium]|nr:tetratricopeptide repeat protein [Bacteroidales bacterium]
MTIPKIILSFLISIIIISIANAQDSPTDLMKKQYAHIENDSVRNQIYIELANKYTANQADSAEIYARLIEENGKTLDSLSWFPDLNRIYSMINFNIGNYDRAMQYDFQTCTFLEKKYNQSESDVVINMMFDNYNDLSIDYFTLNNYDEALKYSLKAKDLFDKLEKENSELYDLKDHLSILNNVGGMYLSNEDYILAEDNYKKALKMALSINDSLRIGPIYNNLGIVNYALKNDKTALYYYRKAISTLTETDNSFHLAKTFNNLGKYYYNQSETDSAFKYFNLVLELAPKIKNWGSAKMGCESLISLYEKERKYDSALKFQKLYQVYSDSLLNEEKIKNISGIESRYKYQKIQEQLEMKQKMAIAKKEKRILMISIAAGSLLFLFIITILLVVLQRSKIRNSKLQEDKLKDQLDSKNRELTTNILYLLRKNEFINNMAKELVDVSSSFSEENQAHIHRIITDLNKNTDKDTWDEFEVRFQQVHKGFYDNLQEKYPQLTPNERKICAFLRLNMSTKEISAITFQSSRSIIIARSRLRKKFNITRDENLIVFLSQF